MAEAEGMILIGDNLIELRREIAGGANQLTSRRQWATTLVAAARRCRTNRSPFRQYRNNLSSKPDSAVA